MPYHDLLVSAMENLNFLVKDLQRILSRHISGHLVFNKDPNPTDVVSAVDTL